MGIAGGLVGDRPQPEPLHRIEAGIADPAVIEGHAFRLAVFQKQFAVIGAAQRFIDDGLRARLVETGPVEKKIIRRCQVGHCRPPC